mmetsp:Transcript_44479/g.107155  ORF Transcript_44479/g.107155 Transcript_44479/m.107155 type:complete len:100 (-) Transcript_44479:298-597(-)
MIGSGAIWNGNPQSSIFVNLMVLTPTVASVGIGEWRPLHLAALWNHVEIAKLLLNRGAGIDERNKDDLTPLALASSKGQLEVVRLFLERGANVEASAIL